MGKKCSSERDLTFIRRTRSTSCCTSAADLRSALVRGSFDRSVSDGFSSIKALNL